MDARDYEAGVFVVRLGVFVLDLVHTTLFQRGSEAYQRIINRHECCHVYVFFILRYYKLFLRCINTWDASINCIARLCPLELLKMGISSTDLSVLGLNTRLDFRSVYYNFAFIDPCLTFFEKFIFPFFIKLFCDPSILELLLLRMFLY